MSQKSARLTPITSLTARTASTSKHLSSCCGMNDQVK